MPCSLLAVFNTRVPSGPNGKRRAAQISFRGAYRRKLFQGRVAKKRAFWPGIWQKVQLTAPPARLGVALGCQSCQAPPQGARGPQVCGLYAVYALDVIPTSVSRFLSPVGKSFFLSDSCRHKFWAVGRDRNMPHHWTHPTRSSGTKHASVKRTRAVCRAVAPHVPELAVYVTSACYNREPPRAATVRHFR